MLSRFKLLICAVMSVSALAQEPVTWTQSLQLDKVMIDVTVEEVSRQLNFPWAVTGLPDDRLLITEKPGRLRIWQNGNLSAPLAGLPDVYYASQGGLLDVIIDPEFSQNDWIYFSYSYQSDGGNTTRLMKAKMQPDGLKQQTVLFEVQPYKDTPVHYGGRLAMLPDNTLVMTTGDGFDYREQAQKPNSLLGKTVRLTLEGNIPNNNPFVGQADHRAEIYTLGHRNPQGLVYDSQRQVLWLHEHGPRGGDELNALESGKNYGWPIATYGKDYSGANITPFQEYPGTENAVRVWTPSIAPSGLAIFRSDSVPALDGALLIGTLVDRDIKVLLPDQTPQVERSLLAPLNYRIRDVWVQGQVIWAVTDEEQGRLLKITLKQRPIQGDNRSHTF